MIAAAAKYFRTAWSELTSLKIVFAVIAIAFMANLNALVDVFAHPEIPYFDHEHLIVGGITALAAAAFFAILTYHIAKLHNREKQIRSLFDLSPDPVYILNTRGEIIQANQAALKKSGYGEQELLGNALYNLLTPTS
jgi:PAS domain-containing protein